MDKASISFCHQRALNKREKARFFLTKKNSISITLYLHSLIYATSQLKPIAKLIIGDKAVDRLTYTVLISRYQGQKHHLDNILSQYFQEQNLLKRFSHFTDIKVRLLRAWLQSLLRGDLDVLLDVGSLRRPVPHLDQDDISPVVEEKSETNCRFFGHRIRIASLSLHLCLLGN